MKKYTVLGVEKIDYKNKQSGQPEQAYQLHCSIVDDQDRRVIGSSVQSIWVPVNVMNSSGYNPTVGDEIQPQYDAGYNGKAYLVGIRKVK